MIVVLCHGCFDCLHYGHVLHLQAAKKLGDRLVVSITADGYTTKRAPIYNDHERAHVLAALSCVNEVYVCDAYDAVPAILRYRPDWFVKGADYAGRGIIAEEAEACAKVGARVAYTDTPKFSTTELIAKLRTAA